MKDSDGILARSDIRDDTFDFQFAARAMLWIGTEGLSEPAWIVTLQADPDARHCRGVAGLPDSAGTFEAFVLQKTCFAPTTFR